MINLLQLYPEHLDLNGDSGNLVVLHQRALWGGLEARISTLSPGRTAAIRPDVLLIGHGSTAAWREIYSDFARLAPTIQEWMNQGTQVLAVSSGFAALHGLLPGLPTSIDRAERKSAFVAEDFEGNRVCGYFNSDLKLPNLERRENLLGTMLHGPLLAKNSWLADEILEKARGRIQRIDLNTPKFDEIDLLEQAAINRAEEQI